MSTDIFKAKQAYALANPCRQAYDCFKPGYYQVQHDSGSAYSIGVTVMIAESPEDALVFQGRPYWMVSVAVSHTRDILPLSRWTDKQKLKAALFVIDALRGVGDEMTDITENDTQCRVLVLRRACTKEEQAQIGGGQSR